MSDDNKSEITITYETLFELLRREKNRDELQKLSKTFYNDVAAYLQEKNKILMPESADLFSDNEREKTVVQMKNAKRMVAELFERREKKIILIALNKARTPSSVIDKEVMLDTEIQFYNNLVAIFMENKANVLESVLNLRIMMADAYITKTPSYPSIEKKPKPVEPKPVSKAGHEDTKLVRFISPVPKFLGKNGEVFGPYESDDVANLPAQIAYVLIKKNRAEAMQTD